MLKFPETNAIYIKNDTVFESKQDELAYLARKQKYNLEDGKVVGKHEGAHFFTKGQRKGLAVGGTVEPLFVI